MRHLLSRSRFAVFAFAIVCLGGVGTASASPIFNWKWIRNGNGEYFKEMTNASTTICALTRVDNRTGTGGGRDGCEINKTAGGKWGLRAFVQTGGSVACQARCWNE